jgi:ATP-dependent Clp protease ATP-binding subunit ClpA
VTQQAQLTSFGRYSREAMKLLFAARAELGRLGGDALLPEHLVLAMLKPEAGGAFEALKAVGCPMDVVRAQIEARVPRGGATPDPGDLPLGPAMIAVLEHAHSATGQIGSRELLLSVLVEGHSTAADVLQANGVSAAALSS